MPPGHTDWIYLPMAKGSPGGLASLVPSCTSLFPGFFRRSHFPKRLSICSGSCPYFASSQCSGSEAAAVSPPAPVLPLPPHVPCLRWDSAHNDPVKQTQVICLWSTLPSLGPKQLQGDVGAPLWVS